MTVCVVGWVAVHFMPNRYESNAKVYLDTKSMLRPLLRGLAVDTNMQEEFVQMTRRTLLSRPNLEKLVRTTDLDIKAKTPEQLELLLRDLTKDIMVSGSDKENIYQLSYKSSDPVLAKKVVEALLNIFMESVLKASHQDTNVTEQFLDAQIKEYQDKLETAENRLKEFKQQNIGTMPTQSGDYFRQLDTASTNLEQAKLELREATRRRDELKRQLTGEGATGSTGVAPLDTGYETRISELEKRLDQLLLSYTERHPDVVALKANINDLREEQRKVREHRPDAAPLPASMGSTRGQAYQELRIEYGRAEAVVAALQVRVQEFSQRIAKLTRRVDVIPEVEAELIKLDRDYQINKTNYDALVARRESAKLSYQAARSTDDVQFKIVEPPLVPVVPVGPNRPVFLTLVLLAGLAAGGGFVFGMAQLYPVFDSARQLRQITELPVLGVVSYAAAPEEILANTRKNRLFYGGCAALLLLYALVLVLEIYLRV